MAEQDDNSRTTKPRIYRLAIASLILAVLAVLTMALALSIVYPRHLRGPLHNVAALIGAISFFLAISSLILGVPSLIRIIASEQRTNSLAFTSAALLLAGVVVGRSLLVPYPRSRAIQLPCNTNMMALGAAMLVYSAYNDDNYPTADKWCDLLLEHTEVKPEQFVCPSSVARQTKSGQAASKGRICTYAINPNCVDMSPPDTVLLFETDAGWNQFGGPELVSTKSHGGKGFNVLYREGRVLFEQDANNLNWSGTEQHK